MRPPRSTPVPGLIVGLRLLRRRPLPLHIPTRSDLSGWRPLGPKGRGCPELRGGISGANKLTGFPAVQSERAACTQLCGDSPPASASLGVACMEGGRGTEEVSAPSPPPGKLHQLPPGKRRVRRPQPPGPNSHLTP